MNLEKLKNDYLNQLTVEGYAKGTISYRKTYLEQFLSFLQKQKIITVQDMTKDVIHSYQVKLSESSFCGSTICSKLTVIKSFLIYLYSHHYLIFDGSSWVRHPKQSFSLPQTILTETEIRLFLSLPDGQTYKGTRDKAILELLYSTGIRRGELVGLDLYDVDLDEKTLKVTGKGGKERIIPFGDVACFWLIKYLEIRYTNDPRNQALFIDCVCGNRLQKETINQIFREYRVKNGIKKRITPHSFRHTCATHLLKHGADVRFIQEILGHASPETTQIYARVEIKDLQKVFQKTHPRAMRKLT